MKNGVCVVLEPIGLVHKGIAPNVIIFNFFKTPMNFKKVALSSKIKCLLIVLKHYRDAYFSIIIFATENIIGLDELFSL